MELFTALTFSVGVNLLMFIPAFLLKTDKLTDISYALTFAFVAVYGLFSGIVNLPNIILASMIVLWAVRLGTYLLIRIRKMGRDERFDVMREDFLKFGRFWLLQGITVWVVLLPSIMFFGNKVERISPFSFLGVVVWALGLSIEAVADMQKYQFINDPENKGQWIDSGLWRYSRHPNYFGEILNWVGIYLFTVYGLRPWQAVLGLLSPIYISGLLIFVSGIPILEKEADKRWGDNEEYRKYKRETSVLVLLPHKQREKYED